MAVHPGDVGVHPPPQFPDLGDRQRVQRSATVEPWHADGDSAPRRSWCSATFSRDKTGTPMIETQTPSSLTMTLVGKACRLSSWECSCHETIADLGTGHARVRHLHQHQDRRRSEVGDTLVEILIALSVVGISRRRDPARLRHHHRRFWPSPERGHPRRDAESGVGGGHGSDQQQPFSNCSGADLYSRAGLHPLSNPAYSASDLLSEYESANPATPLSDTYKFSPSQAPSTTCPSVLRCPPQTYADSPQGSRSR